MRTVRVTIGGAGDPGGRGGRRIGLVLLMALVLPILITAGVGYGVYHAFFRVLELRALLFEGGRVARGAVLPLPDGAVVLSQENARPVADVLRAGARPAAAARVYLTRVGLASSDKPRWDLALDGVTGPDAGNARLWADGDRVLLAAGERLEARALATGALAWTASMSDAIHAACRQCLAAGAGRVVVLAADGVVQAFDGATGRALWRATTRLNRPIAPDLEIAGDLVSVVDRGPGAGAVELALLRADSGEPVRRIRPACAASPWTDTTQAHHDGDRVILALGRAGVAACFEAWEVRRGARLWQAALPRPGTRIDESRVPWYVASGGSLALAQARVGPGERGTVWALALDTGRLRSLAMAEGYETRVLDARDGVLLLRATRQRGTVRDELWAMDLDRGSVLWDKPLPSGAGGALPRWTARAVPAGVALLVALDRPNRLAYETLDLRTGRSLASVTAEVEAAGWEGTAWTAEAAWLTIASPYPVAFEAGTVTRVWPWQSLSNCQNIGGKVVCTR